MGFRGPDATQLMAELFGEKAAGLRPFHSCTAQIKGLQVTVVRSVPLGNDYLLLTDAHQASVLWAMLSEAVESVGGTLVGETALEAARIDAGWPRFGQELSEDYIPLAVCRRDGFSPDSIYSRIAAI